ncbi:erythromycin esterase family protein [Skermania sp. ID1734]|uniref:erythromycin esterase family protein n=1 Tax=Skermania sp. ID1734 TaxID=2597516 RepID=UPI0011804078|nr:erythromycin esterase family protein [Skermania sp. ID1734]TSE01532.1 erythromycin esterase family protein [Skermania sp. ID1734]
MSTAAALHRIGREIADPERLGRALDELLSARSSPPALFALGEPTHGITAFPLLRNEILAHLVERGCRSVALEIDFFAASMVDDFVAGTTGDIDAVLASGFSHRFGAIPGNRELVEWLRTHNARCAPQDRVRFYGFDMPGDQTDIPSPRRHLYAVNDYLPAALRPDSARDLDSLLGSNADWTNPAAMYDATASVGDSDSAKALRIVAEDLASALRRSAPSLRPADPSAHDQALSHARTAQGLLRYHAAMASPGPDRIASMLSVRAEMMAENLHAIDAQESSRGPCLVFAHNVHLQRMPSHMQIGARAAQWGSAGELIGLTLGERYLFVATDASPDSDPGTLQRALAEATSRRALFPTPELRAALPPSIGASTPIVPGHVPLSREVINGADAVIFIADTDGKRHQYW